MLYESQKVAKVSQHCLKPEPSYLTLYMGWCQSLVVLSSESCLVRLWCLKDIRVLAGTIFGKSGAGRTSIS